MAQPVGAQQLRVVAAGIIFAQQLRLNCGFFAAGLVEHYQQRILACPGRLEGFAVAVLPFEVLAGPLPSC